MEALSGRAAAATVTSNVDSSPPTLVPAYPLLLVWVVNEMESRPHWSSSKFTASTFAVSSNSPMTIRCADGVPVGVSGNPAIAFHCCGARPRFNPLTTGVQAALG